MKTARTFKFESFVYLAGEMVNKGFAFLILPLLIRLLTREQFGIYSLVITIWPILVIFFGKSFGSYIVRGFYQWDEPERRQNISSVFWFNGIVIIVLFMIFHLIGPWLSGFLKTISYFPYLQFAVYIAILKVINNNFLSVFRAERKPHRVFLCSMIYLVSSLLFMLIFIQITDDHLLAILSGMLSGLLLANVAAFWMIKKYFARGFNTIAVKQGVFFVLPLIPHALAGWVLNLSDRILIERFFSLDELAVYALAYQLAFGLDIILTSLNQAWIPAFYDFMNHKQNQEMARSIRFYFGVLLLLAALLILFSREVILILGKNLYADAAQILPIIVLSVIVHGFYYIYVSSLMHRHKTRYIPVITIVSGLMNIGLNLWLLPEYGYAIAAWTTLASYISLAILARYFSRKYDKLPVPWKILFPAAGMILLLLYGSMLTASLSTIIQIILKTIMFISFALVLQGLGFMKLAGFVRQIIEKIKTKNS